VREYRTDENATQDAVRAGYYAKTAGAQGHRLLKDVEISTAIAQARAKLHAEIEDCYAISKDRVVRELVRSAFASMADYIMADYIKVDGNGTPVLDLSNCDREQLSAIAEIRVDAKGRVSAKLYNRNNALMALAKLHGYVVDKEQHDLDPVGMLAEMIRSMKRSALPIGVGHSPRAGVSPATDEH